MDSVLAQELFEMSTCYSVSAMLHELVTKVKMPYVIQTQFSVLNVYLPVNFSFAHMTEYLFEYDELEDLESDSICRFDVPTYMNDLFE